MTWSGIKLELGDFVVFEYHGYKVGVIICSPASSIYPHFLEGQELWHESSKANRDIWFLGGHDTTLIEVIKP
jgi:hypothetical protein